MIDEFSIDINYIHLSDGWSLIAQKFYRWDLVHLNNKMLFLVIHVGYEGSDIAEKYITHVNLALATYVTSFIIHP